MSRFYVSQTKQREAALASAANHQSDNAPSQLVFLSRGAHEWKISMAPKPEEVLWENALDQDYTRRCCWRRHGNAAHRCVADVGVLVLATHLLLLVLTIVLILGPTAMSIRFGLQPHMWDFLNHLEDTYGIAQVAALVVPPLLFVALKTISARLLKRLARFERHSTGSKCEGSYLAKSFFIYLGLNVALPTLGYGLLARGLSEAEDFKTLFAEFVTSSSVSVLMIEALFYCPLRLLRGLPVYEYRRRKQRCKELPAAECHEASSLAKEEECRGTLDPRRTHRSAGSGATQSSAALKFRAMAPPAAFDLSRAYAESLSFFALALLYSLVSPLVIPTAAMYFFCKYRADKHIFEEQYGDTVRQPQFSRRLRAVNRYLCLAVFIAQLGPFSYFYFLGSSATETAISGFILAGTLATYLLLVTRTVMWRGRHYDVFSCTEHISRRGRSKHYSAAELAAPRAVSRPYTPSRQCMWGDLTETQQSELAEVLGLEQLGDSNDKQRTRQKPAETTMNGKRPTKDKVKIENPMLEAKKVVNPMRASLINAPSPTFGSRLSRMSG